MDAAAVQTTERRPARCHYKPSQLADLFLQETLTPGPKGSRPGVVRWRESFYRWTGQGYEAWSTDGLRADVTAFIRRTGQGAPARGFVRDVLLNLGGIAGIRSDVEPPIWLHDKREPQRADGYLCLTNGVLNLADYIKEPTARPLSRLTPDLFNLNALPFPFERQADCLRWQAFLDRVLPDTESQEVLQEWMGYCLVPTQKFQRILLMQGEGANGKSVVQAVLRELVGPANCAAVPLEGLHLPHATAGLLGKLVNLSTELARILPAGEGILKAISGGDPVAVDRKFCAVFSMTLCARFTIAANSLPRFSDRSEGLWRRLLVLPFPVRIPEGERRPFDRFVAELCGELSGILNWAVKGLARLQDRGRFFETEAMRQFKADCRAISNPARTWCDENLKVVRGAAVAVKAAYQAYRSSCAEGGFRPLAVPHFSTAVRRWAGRQGLELPARLPRPGHDSRERIFPGLVIEGGRP